jgi:single-strand DNA-binding protein
MPNYATATLIGHLGRDVDIKHTPSGDIVGEFSLATNRKRKTGDTTTWWRCALWGKRAEILAQYVRKGQAVLISGEPYMREWTDKDGNARLSLEIDVKDFTFLGRDESAPQQSASRQQPATRMDAQNRASMAAQAPADFDDDVPF